MNPSFKRLLVHRCSLVLPGQIKGVDDYGRDIFESVTIGNVPCKADQIRESVSVSQTGTDFILTNVLFIEGSVEVQLDMKIVDIFDRQGKLVLPGSYSVRSMMPIYRRRFVHHYEVMLQRE
ncbi:hypothetical protein [Fictibacillus sp. NRS-1165]|uniref:hypothetical protein n=1 Tax=Fictibacillus sp. NRS-1165 TaxID=3144463 RepID=UPI003D20A5EA